MKSNKFLLFGGIAAAGLLALWWFSTQEGQSSSAPTGAQNAVNQNAQIGVTGGWGGAQGTMPDIGNLLSYNQPVGALSIAPQATSVMTGVTGDYSNQPWNYAMEQNV